ncbi:hypothetical protein ACFQ4N_15445 [Oceanobacillus iheyensis]|uniref:hypothetical protein n=1 Tax=Oceanobacillus iheyensis TaxID=182710 RepID=UPI00362D2907
MNNTFTAELASRVGSTIEIATDNNLIEGVLASVSLGVVLVIETGGYSDSNRRYIALNAINFVRFSSAA